MGEFATEMCKYYEAKVQVCEESHHPWFIIFTTAKNKFTENTPQETFWPFCKNRMTNILKQYICNFAVMSSISGKSCERKLWLTCPCFSYLKIWSVIGVRHEPVLVGTLQLETMCNASAGRAVLAIAVEVGQAVNVAQFSEVFMCAFHSTSAQVLQNTCYYINDS